MQNGCDRLFERFIGRRFKGEQGRQALFEVRLGRIEGANL
jgi:hypothetical protein